MQRYTITHFRANNFISFTFTKVRSEDVIPTKYIAAVAEIVQIMQLIKTFKISDEI